MRMNSKALGLEAGILWGATVCLVTVWILIVGSERQTLAKLGVLWFSGFSGGQIP